MDKKITEIACFFSTVKCMYFRTLQNILMYWTHFGNDYVGKASTYSGITKKWEIP